MKKMATETVGGGMTQSDLDAKLAEGGWKAIVMTPEQQAENDAWATEIMAQSAAERRQRRYEAMRARSIGPSRRTSGGPTKRIRLPTRCSMSDQYPRGQLTPDDEGVLQIRVFEYNGEIVIDYGKMISWIGMGPEQAEQFGQMIIDKAREVKR